MTEQSKENIVSSCTHCGHTLTLPPEYLGKMIRCQMCSEAYTVQAGAGQPGNDSLTSSRTAQDDEEIKSCCPKCSQKLALPKEYLGKHIRCPECSEVYEVVPVNKEPVPDSSPKSSDPQKKPSESKPVPDKKAPLENENAPETEKAAAEKSVKEETEKHFEQVPERPKPKKPNRVKTGDMVRKYSDEVSPDSLMTDFKGKSILVIALFTIIVHVVLLGGTSINFLKEKLFSDTRKLSEEERKREALADATLAIRDIAAKYALTSGDITSQFSAAGSRADKVADKSEEKKQLEKKPEEKPEKKPEEKPKEKSELEKKFEKKEPGPEEFDFKDDF